MKNKVSPYLLSIIFALVISHAFFFPLLEGKELIAHDQHTAIGAQNEIHKYVEKTGKSPLWTNSMFSGMPSYTIWYKKECSYWQWLFKTLIGIGAFPVSIFMLAFLGAYFCLVLNGIKPWLSFGGALLYAMGSHFFVIISAGQITKLLTMGFIAPVAGSIYYAYKKKPLIGFLLVTILLTFQIASAHPQITYYTAILVGLLVIALAYEAIKAKTIKKFITVSLLMLFSALIAVGYNANSLLVMKEYSKYSTRGENVLSQGNSDGLDKDYILTYSYDATEALTAFIPRLKGGGNAEPVSENSNLYKALSRTAGKAQARKIIANAPMYWGSQPIVSGPNYFGAITLYLFILGLFIVKGTEKWWLFSAVVVSFLLSLGKYLPGLSDWLLDNLPMYNKFRDVKNIVFIQAFALWFLGMLALKELIQNEGKRSPNELIALLKWPTIITGGFALLFVLFPSIAGDFTADGDARLREAGWPVDALIADRMALVRKDAFRSFMFVALTFGLIYLFLKKKVKPIAALAIGCVLILVDLWPVNKRYVNSDDFKSKKKTEQEFAKSKADEFILQDPDPHYRVLSLVGSQMGPFNDGTTSYWHKSIGGYSGAKMGRYQDLISTHLQGNMQQMYTRFQGIKTQADAANLFEGLDAINMVNTKYVIYNKEATPLVNQQRFGNAWFVKDVKHVSTSREELNAVGTTGLKDMAIIHTEFEDLLSDFKADSLASIKLTSYKPDEMIYAAKAAGNQLAVFSEIYYPAGWNVYINGEKAEYFRANYVLRAMMVPEGEHEIVFKFEPETYNLGNKISAISSIVIFLLLGVVIVLEYRKNPGLFKLKSNLA